MTKTEITESDEKLLAESKAIIDQQYRELMWKTTVTTLLTIFVMYFVLQVSNDFRKTP
jgi:hypothetical protein